MIYTDAAAAAAAFREQIDQARRILLLTHVNPDGDAVGSLLGAAHALRDSGKEPICLLASPAPSYSLILPGAEWLEVYRRGDALPAADLIWMLDTATPDRVGAISEEHGPALLAGPLLITDHHVTNDGGGMVNLIDPSAASTADLLFRLLGAMGQPVSPAAATCLLLGVTTDTQSFQTSSTTPQTLRTSAELLEAGADLRAVINAVYFSIPESTMRLSALALSGLRREGPLFWVTVSQAQLVATGATDEATDDTVQQLQRSAGMRICALFRERVDGTVKLSLRSVPGINVAAIAQTWGGGGHTQAAGATLPMSLAEAPDAVLPLLRAALAKAP
ncbi:MAG: bifunctional oligoribonuclease/PAP phosphatase NrnA [Chloroflexales bacterium]|nr:bifunctional oligoribonuclease/PAP phosphatase NrnA [Chloroflexales bacterium]